ncbi:type II restriction endonuclease [Brevibacillus borstelensis]|uniref:type II restriction endonuclease n=1 Tax=Brevibacillus borstelensis TaxID=45462 RepID=UPI00203EB503|nr:type II restriction endonuclease [Brevibacillus borstelensis]MCM3623985.1 type II restriction endonuclease [Brevibacillus borstelensis]
MQKGFLSQYFEGVAIKRLSTVEVDTSVSNQHEFNGSKPLRNLFGDGRRTYMARFLWLSGENEGISSEGKVTWYDAREFHPTRSEYRLYFNSNDVMDQAKEGDLLIVAKRPDEEIYMIIVPAQSTLENQLIWLFGLGEIGFRFNFQPIEDGHDPEVDYAVRYILEEMGIEVEEPDTDYLDTVLEPYLSTGFPTTSVFSALARNTLRDVSPLDDPDNTLLKWMEHEEKLFKRLERHLVALRLQEGFENQDETDVEGFIQFSLSVHNRRKSRVGYALENHLEEIFKAHGVTYSRTKVTENKSKPDFLFPDISFYHDLSFPTSRLTMLGVKSTCKDRWRQVLAEANRIQTKHLLTLEPGISENQTEEMQASNLQLILPQRLHETYKPSQRDWLMNLGSFIQLVKKRQ